MALDLPESESQTPDGVPLGWEAPWEKPQMMVVEEREGMAREPRVIFFPRWGDLSVGVKSSIASIP